MTDIRLIINMEIEYHRIEMSYNFLYVIHQ